MRKFTLAFLTLVMLCLWAYVIWWMFLTISAFGLKGLLLLGYTMISPVGGELLFPLLYAILFTGIRSYYARMKAKEFYFRDFAIITGVISYFFILPFVLSMNTRHAALGLAKNDKNALEFEWPELVAISGSGSGSCTGLCADLLFSDNYNISGVIIKTNYRRRNKRDHYRLYKLEDREHCDTPDLGIRSYDKGALQYVYDHAAIGTCLVSEEYSGSYPSVEISMPSSNNKKWKDGVYYLQYKITRNQQLVAQKTLYLYRVYAYPFLNFSTLRASYGLARLKLGLSSQEDEFNSFSPISIVLSMTRDLPPLDLIVYNQFQDEKSFRKYMENYAVHYIIPTPGETKLVEASINILDKVSADLLSLNELEKEQLKKLNNYLYETREQPSETRSLAQASILRLARLRIENCTVEDLGKKQDCRKNEYFSLGVIASFYDEIDTLSPAVKAGLAAYKAALIQYVSFYQKNGRSKKAHYHALPNLAGQLAKETSPNQAEVKMVLDICFKENRARSCKDLVEKYAVKDGIHINDFLKKIAYTPVGAKTTKGKLIARNYFEMLDVFSEDVLNHHFDEIHRLINIHFNSSGQKNLFMRSNFIKVLVKGYPASTNTFKMLLLSEVSRYDAAQKANVAKLDQLSKIKLSEDRRRQKQRKYRAEIFNHDYFAYQLFKTGCKLSIGLNDEEFSQLQDVLLGNPNLFNYSKYLSYFQAINRFEEFKENFLAREYDPKVHKQSAYYFDENTTLKCH